VVVVGEVLDEVVIRECAPGVVVVGVVVVGAEPGAAGAALGMGWIGGVMGLMVVAKAEPGAVGAALGMGWIGVTRLTTASGPSSTASSCSRRRSRRATRTRWTSAVATARLLVVSLGLQVFRERCHEQVTLCERCARLVGCLLDEDLHPHKGASRCGIAGIAQLIRRIAGDLCEGVHAQDRSAEALDRIPRAEVVWLRMARGRVVEVAMVRHRRPQARPGFSRMPSQAPSGLRSAWMGLRLRR
jgi:hypothetical protein